MNTYQFESLVREMCLHVGVKDWQSVLRASAIELDGRAVNVGYDEKCAPGRVSLSIDLGGPPDLAAPHYLLVENGVADAPDGWFALKAATGSVVYHASFTLTDDAQRGAKLALAITALVEAATLRFAQVADACLRDRAQILAELGFANDGATV